ncbi:MAG: cyclopropane fatty acyl phospholipid synthase [Deltaproteobacteria bacterium]|nr:cyclopropane fatty acyl phospholipid synthase [Deltaproteobacteria bacterium]
MAKKFIQDVLSSAGIKVNGTQPWDIHIKNERFYDRTLKKGSLGLGESYMDGWWECDRIDEFFYRLIQTDPEAKIRNNKKMLFKILASNLINKSRKSKAYEIGEKHYDIGNELFSHMLDKRMVYTCGYWKDTQSLDEAQEAKLDLICRKLQLKPQHRVLDIGCGWGSFAKFAAEKYGAHVVGVTVSKEQAELGMNMCKGLPVELRLQDYRDVKEKFDHIVSLGMFEHVGFLNYHTYMKVAHNCLKDDGLFLLHTIGNIKTQTTTDEWMAKYIFPNSHLPSVKQISSSLERLFRIEDLHNIGTHYDTTLMAWFRNFDANWHKLSHKYGDRFYRMWKYYLLMCAGLFRARSLQLWQIVLSKKGSVREYASVR